MKSLILLTLLFAMSAMASKECDNAGENGDRIEIDSNFFTEKPDPDPKYRHLIFAPSLYCDAVPAGGECADWFSHEEYVNRLVKSGAVICSYKVNSIQIKSGVQSRTSKLVVYVEK